MNIPINILALIFVLSVLIVVHEFGHYAVAKGFRFPVEIFSLGFGKRLFGWKRKETDYRVSVIPLGGYVKVVGLGPDESDVVAGAEPAAPLGPRWQRLLVLVAGPAMNLVLALLLTTAAFVIGMEVLKYQDEPPLVKHVEARSPAERAGVKVDDLIVAIGGKPVTTWREVEMDLGLAPRENIPVDLKRGAETVHVTLRPEPDRKYDIGYTGLNPFLAPVVGGLVKNYPAEKAGLKTGDRIVSVGGSEVTGYYDVVRAIREAAAAGGAGGPKPIEFVVERDGQRLTIPITPREDSGSWRIGFAPRYETAIKRLGLVDAFAAAAGELVRQTQMTGVTVARLFRGTSSMRQLSGPDRHREVLRRGRAERALGPPRPDGNPLAAARPPEPPSDPAPRRRADLRHASRGRRPPRFPAQAEGAAPPGGLRLSRPRDGDRSLLRRPQERQLLIRWSLPAHATRPYR